MADVVGFPIPFTPAKRLRRMAAQALIDAERFEADGDHEIAASLRVSAAEWTREADLSAQIEEETDDYWKGAAKIIDIAKARRARERARA